MDDIRSFSFLSCTEGDKILVIYNFGSKGGEVDYRGIEKPSGNGSRAFWDVDYFSDLPNLKAFWDKKRDIVHFIEFGEAKLKTKLIKYKSREFEDGLNMDLKLSPSDFVDGDDYILIKGADAQLALLEKSEDGLELKWVKKINADLLEKINFSGDGLYFTPQKIVFVDFISSSHFAVVMDVATGELESYTSKLSTVDVQPVDVSGRLLKVSLPEKEKYEESYVFGTMKNEFFGPMGKLEAISDDRSTILVRSQTGLNIWRTRK